MCHVTPLIILTLKGSWAARQFCRLQQGHPRPVVMDAGPDRKELLEGGGRGASDTFARPADGLRSEVGFTAEVWTICKRCGGVRATSALYRFVPPPTLLPPPTLHTHRCIQELIDQSSQGESIRCQRWKVKGGCVKGPWGRENTSTCG